MTKIIGIDLGTANSCIAVYEAGYVSVIPNSLGERTMPSVVAHTKTGERLVGMAAKKREVTDPERTVASIKRKMGTAHRVSIEKNTRQKRFPL